MFHFKKGALPNHLNGRSLNVKVIPTVCNLENMLHKLVELGRDVSKLKQWEKRSYQAYLIEDIKNKILTEHPSSWRSIIRNHILNSRSMDLGASVIDIYLVAYVAEDFGIGRERFFQYVKDNNISDKDNSANAIWQVGIGDGVYLGLINQDGSVKDWDFMKKWIHNS